MFKRKTLIFSTFIFALLVGFIFNSFTALAAAPKESSKLKTLDVHFIDVGQGDSILLQTDKTTMLIDGGSKNSGVPKYLNSLKIKKIDVLVITHPHEDHIGGLISIIKDYDIGKIYMPNVTHNSKTFEDLLDAIEAKKLKITAPEAGTSFDFGTAQVNILGPTKKFTGLNNNSIVLNISHGDNSFLFTGDIESTAEKAILDKKYDVSADVLKVAHHGSTTSTTKAFLDKVKPQYAVIMTGKDNSYGHPEEDILKRLTDAKATVYRTDHHGTIVFKSDGKELTVKTEKEPSKTKASEKPKDTSKTKDAPKETPKETPKDTTVTPAPKASAAAEPAPAETSYIGNKNSKKFHKTVCRTLPDEKNRVPFSSRTDAINAGYDPCGNCKP